jgi:hypothetical protein
MRTPIEYVSEQEYNEVMAELARLEREYQANPAAFTLPVPAPSNHDDEELPF